MIFFLLLIAFLFPLATYLLVLGMINRRRSPLMIPGTWDFVGVLCGTSGFILAGGWFLLHVLADQGRALNVFHFQENDGSSERDVLIWVFLALYFLFIVLGVAYILAQRRLQTAIYNINPQSFERVLEQVLDARGLLWTRTGDQLIIQTETAVVDPQHAHSAGPTTSAAQSHPLRTHGSQGEVASLALHLSKLGFSVGLKWECFTDRSEHAVRQEVERALDRELAHLVTEDNPVALWLVGCSFLMLVTIFLSLVMLLLNQWALR